MIAGTKKFFIVALKAKVNSNKAGDTRLWFFIGVKNTLFCILVPAVNSLNTLKSQNSLLWFKIGQSGSNENHVLADYNGCRVS
jgi:hypothetical protein